MTERGYEPERIAGVFAALAADAADPDGSMGVVLARLVGVKGAGIVLMAGGRPMETVCVSDRATEEVEDLEYTLGEGPCVEAYRRSAPVLSGDLAADQASWPEFSDGAVRLGVRAAFGFPLLVESVCIGALNLYDDHVGALSEEQFADAVAVAYVASRTVMRWQAAAVPGVLARQLEQVPAHRAVIHQATGMLSVQAGLQVDDAQVWLRAYAFAESRAIGDVADDVVSRRIRFDRRPA